MVWQQWPSVAFTDRQLLPNYAGIYVVADANQFVWYVGQALNLQGRWLGKGHHRYPQLIRTHKKLGHRIYWQAVEAHRLNEQERFYITHGSRIYFSGSMKCKNAICSVYPVSFFQMTT